MGAREPDSGVDPVVRLRELLGSAGLAPDDVETLLPSFRLRVVPDGAEAYAPGEPGGGIGLLVEGEVELLHAGVVFARESAGAVLEGAGALSPGVVRSIECRALGPCRLAEVAGAELQRLEQLAPLAVLRLFKHVARTFVEDVAERLRDRPQALDVLLFPEPQLSRVGTLRVRVDGAAREVPTGVRLGALLPEVHDGHRVVAATIDTYVCSLVTAVSSDCTVNAVTTATTEGRRIVRRSLDLLALEAARAEFPELAVSVRQSVGFGTLLAVDAPADLERVAERTAARMRTLVAERAGLREEWWTVPEARECLLAQSWGEAAELLAFWRLRAVPLVSYGELHAISVGPLLPHVGSLQDFRLFACERHLVLVPGAEARDPLRVAVDSNGGSDGSWDEAALSTAAHVTAMTEASHRWLATLGVRSVADLNRRCVDGSIEGLIRVAEGAHERRVTRIADAIAARRPHVVCLAGPSSSGKTTMLARLRVQLQVAGINPMGISLDDYYVDREDTPRDEHGEYDFESFEAIRTDLLQEHLGRLVAGEEVTLARFDFVVGRSHPQGGATLRLGEHGLLILEGIHALNPRLLERLPGGEVFRIYICPLVTLPFDGLTRLPASDLRLIRRSVRDRRHRGTSAADSIARWQSVRRGERNHIFPYQHLADETFDTSLVYELAVLKVFAERSLLEVPQDHASYPVAFRMLQLLNHFVAIHPDAVPPTSLLQEFIGGH